MRLRFIPAGKKMLLLIGGALAAVIAFAIYANGRIRATAAEAARALPGDDLIPQPVASVNHAIAINCPPCDVWPWLVQMGSGRAGWYSYDIVDNGGTRSAVRILPEHQRIAVGDVLPALPGVRNAFVVAQFEPEHSLVLAWRQPGGRYQTTWTFVLEQPQPGRTRVIVRGRAASGYHPFGLPEWAALRIGRLAHLVMQRKQLLNIARRAEAH